MRRWRDGRGQICDGEDGGVDGRVGQCRRLRRRRQNKRCRWRTWERWVDGLREARIEEGCLDVNGVVLAWAVGGGGTWGLVEEAGGKGGRPGAAVDHGDQLGCDHQEVGERPPTGVVKP